MTSRHVALAGRGDGKCHILSLLQSMMSLVPGSTSLPGSTRQLNKMLTLSWLLATIHNTTTCYGFLIGQEMSTQLLCLWTAQMVVRLLVVDGWFLLVDECRLIIEFASQIFGVPNSSATNSFHMHNLRNFTGELFFLVLFHTHIFRDSCLNSW